MKLGRGKSDWLYCDVDGTLLIWPTHSGAPLPGETPAINVALVDQIKKWRSENSGTLVIWSMGGIEHAEMAMKLCGLQGAICIRKPGLAIDDNPFVWGKRKLDVVGPSEFKAAA